jgi:uncharacterized protein
MVRQVAQGNAILQVRMTTLIEPALSEREELHALALQRAHRPIRPNWYEDNRLVTILFNSSSVGIPLGEALVAEAAEAVIPHLRHKNLIQEAHKLIHEERAHILVHEAYNNYLRRHGFPVECQQARLQRMLDRVNRHSSLKTRLAIGAAFEHFTAISAKQILEHNILENEQVDDRLERVWTWHALEELDHRNATFDLYHAMGGGYLRRAWGALIAMFLFIHTHYTCFFTYLYQQGLLFNLKVWRQGLPKMLGRNGIYGHLFTNWLRYFKPGFHPTQIPITNPLQKQLHHYHIEHNLADYFRE